MGKPKRARSLPDNVAKAVVRNLRISPQKLNLVAGLIRGKKVSQALADLEFSRRRIAIDVRKCVMSAVANAENLRSRAEGFRMRMVHMMVLSALVLRPIPREVAERVSEYSRELGIDDQLLRTVQQFATSDKALAAVDFERKRRRKLAHDERFNVDARLLQ